MRASPDVIVVGSANLDLVATADRAPAPGETVLGSTYAEHAGGKGLNQAVAAARAGAAVAFVAAVGADAAGERLLSVARAEGIDLDDVVVLDDEPTGRALIVVDRSAENSIVVVPGANGHVRVPDPLHPAPAPGSVVLAQLEVPLDRVAEALHRARAAGMRTILNPAPAAPVPPALLAGCDVVVPNEHEVELLGGVDALLDAGVGVVVVTRGAAGVDVTTPDGRRRHQRAFAVSPVDTTGAGDAFCGALAAALARGLALADAVTFGAAAGALATTGRGAVPSLPRRDAIDRLVSSGA